ncbi:uncharacterized protein LOC133902010 isoform X3 [Phragmites australis]|uniref:uncharacterized protein LOC133902010 isoform X3 n=1 Tax=Phragmites australis TaxID=29695 RepID=UPI002D765446|nr:uncharacterized protein LOC133902010 isoform X3 [Phragmites australis]
MAASAGKVAMCKFLIKDLKLDVDAAGDDGVTPLIFAIFGSASTAVARLLLDRGADPNKPASDESTPLHTATIRAGSIREERLLILQSRRNVSVTAQAKRGC